MNDQYARNVIEAALLAAGRPLTADELISLFDERDGFIRISALCEQSGFRDLWAAVAGLRIVGQV